MLSDEIPGIENILGNRQRIKKLCKFCYTKFFVIMRVISSKPNYICFWYIMQRFDNFDNGIDKVFNIIIDL